MSTTGTAEKTAAASKGLTIGRILGAPIVLDWSWFIAAAVITVLFAPWVRSYSPDLGAAAWGVAFTYAVLLFASVFLHELAHGVVGTLNGQKVGVIELNIWGGFTRFEPQIDRDPKHAATSNFVISIVGPFVNIALALFGWWGMHHTQPGSVTWLLLVAVTFANAALGLINLLPGIPLDGGWALQALVWRVSGSQFTGTIAASIIGRVIAVIFVLVSVVLPLMQGSRPSIVTVIWTTAIAVMLWVSAADAARHAKRARKMETYDLHRVIQPAIAASWNADVEQTLEYADSATESGSRTLIVVLDDSGLPYGLLDRHAATSAIVGQRADQPVQVGQFARPLGGWIGVPEHITAPHLLESLTHRPKAQFCLIMRDDTLVGIIDLQEFFDELLAV